MKEVPLRTLYKRNCIKLAKHHKRNCEGDCGISLILLMQMMEECDISLSDEEKKIFL